MLIHIFEYYLFEKFFEIYQLLKQIYILYWTVRHTCIQLLSHVCNSLIDHRSFAGSGLVLLREIVKIKQIIRGYASTAQQLMQRLEVCIHG